MHFIVKIRYNHKSITSVMNTNRITGPPERMGTWGLVPTIFGSGLVNPNNYAHHYIGLSPLDFWHSGTPELPETTLPSRPLWTISYVNFRSQALLSRSMNMKIIVLLIMLFSNFFIHMTFWNNFHYHEVCNYLSLSVAIMEFNANKNCYEKNWLA